MSSVEEIKFAIVSLSHEDCAHLCAWFSERDWEKWDKEVSGEAIRVAEGLRLSLGSRIRSGKLKTTADPVADGSPYGHPPAALRALARRCDAVASDDGFFVGRGNMGESGASVCAFSTLYVLETLGSSGLATAEEHRELLARLRAAGYPLPPGTG